jgi:hypothetical protein
MFFWRQIQKICLFDLRQLSVSARHYLYTHERLRHSEWRPDASLQSAMDPHRAGSAEVRRVCLCPLDTHLCACCCVHERTSDGSPSSQGVRDVGGGAVEETGGQSENRKLMTAKMSTP